MSKHEVKVVALPAIAKHPNADTLGIVEVSGYTVVVRLADWKEGDLAVYIEPDYIVPAGVAAFAFLGDKRRIKVKKLRNVYSQGLLVPVSAFGSGLLFDDAGLWRPARAGDDVMQQLGIVRYEPETHAGKSYVGAARENYNAPAAVRAIQKYDLEPLRKNRSAFIEGERVIITEKVHGCNARYTFRDGQMWLGSRTRWVEDDGANVWSRALASAPWIRTICERTPGLVLFGEVYGRVQDLDYGLGSEVRFVCFDAQSPDGEFCPAWILFVPPCEVEQSTPPVLYDGPYNYELALELAEGPSVLAELHGGKHVREGCVVKPATERQHYGQRVALKVVGNGYLERA
jgi:RNA ligase (TIGR02306 family)